MSCSAWMLQPTTRCFSSYTAIISFKVFCVTTSLNTSLCDSSPNSKQNKSAIYISWLIKRGHAVYLAASFVVISRLLKQLSVSHKSQNKFRCSVFLHRSTRYWFYFQCNTYIIRETSANSMSVTQCITECRYRNMERQKMCDSSLYLCHLVFYTSFIMVVFWWQAFIVTSTNDGCECSLMDQNTYNNNRYFIDSPDKDTLACSLTGLGIEPCTLGLPRPLSYHAIF